jgi:hypothetical protein
MWRLSLVAVLLVGCGGVVEGGSRQDGSGEEPSTNPGKVPVTSSDEDADAGGGLDDPNADTELGECKLGYAETYLKDCAWVAEQRCYETRQMACNCVCPRDRDSQCTSGFGSGPEGHVWVACH